MKTKLLVLVFCLFCGILVFSQSKNDSIFELGSVVENTPIFRKNKGLEELMKFITDNLQYPETALKDSLEGRVITQFWIDTLGNTYNHKIVRGVREDLDNEALRVVKLLKYDVPAMQRGKPIASAFTLPIIFNMNGTQNFNNPEYSQFEKTGKYMKENSVRGIFFTFPLEIPFINNALFNRQLNQYNYPASDYPSLNAGIGLQLHLDRTIWSVSFTGSSRKSRMETTETSSEHFAFSGNFGYNVLPTYRFSLYPYIGVKGVGLKYSFKEIVTQNISFSDYLNSRTEYKEFNRWRGYIDLGIGFSHQKSHLLNLRAGYLLPFSKSRCFDSSNKEISDVPPIEYNFYLNLTIGLGGIISERNFRRPQFQ